MDQHIRTTHAAKDVIQSRRELATLFKVEEKRLAEIIAEPARFFTEFLIPKTNGEARLIRPPCRMLRSLQRRILNVIYQRVRLRPCLHGGIPRKSIITHAQAHVGRSMVATLDIRKFFPSTTQPHLLPVMAALGFRSEAGADVLGLVMLENSLPQGAPTSSILANLAFAAGDSQFIRICGSKGLAYSRYVDDVAVSGDRDFRDLRGPFVEAIHCAAYAVAPEKIRFMTSSVRQVVTGLVVNDKMRPTREFIRELKDAIRLCVKVGARDAANLDGISVATLKSQLTGRVAHVQNVDAALGKRLRGMLCGVDWRSHSALHIGMTEGQLAASLSIKLS